MKFQEEVAVHFHILEKKYRVYDPVIFAWNGTKEGDKKQHLYICWWHANIDDDKLSKRLPDNHLLEYNFSKQT